MPGIGAGKLADSNGDSVNRNTDAGADKCQRNFLKVAVAISLHNNK